MSGLLEVAGLRAAYGATRVLHGMDFQLAERSITALLGANGAGKTTTLRAICGMVRTEGEVRFAAKRIDGRRTEDIARLGIAHVPDGRGTFLHLTTEENLRLGAYVRNDRAGFARDGSLVFARVSAQAEVLLGRQIQKGAAPIRHVRDAEPRNVLGAPAGDALAGEADLALGAHHAAERAQRGGLAGAVRAEERGDRFFLHGEIDAVEDARRAVGGAQTRGLEDRAQAEAPR